MPTSPIVCQSPKATFTVDAVVSRDVEYKNEVTQYPVEDGFSVTDAVIKGQPRLHVSGIVTNMTGTQDGGNETPGKLTGGGNLEIFNQTRAVLDDPTQYTVTIQGEAFENMAIESYILKQDTGDSGGGVISIDIDFTQIRVVSSKRTKAPAKKVDKKAKGKTGESNKKVGKNTPAEPKPEAPAADAGAKAPSLGKAGFDYLKQAARDYLQGGLGGLGGP